MRTGQLDKEDTREKSPLRRSSVGPGPMGQEFSGNCDVASRNALLHNGATNATRSRRSDSEEAPPCRTRVLGAELDGSLATPNFARIRLMSSS